MVSLALAAQPSLFSPLYAQEEGGQGGGRWQARSMVETKFGIVATSQTLASAAGVSRAALYRTYPRLKDDFEQRLAQARAAGQVTDPRDAQITRLKDEIQTLGHFRVTRPRRSPNAWPAAKPASPNSPSSGPMHCHDSPRSTTNSSSSAPAPPSSATSRHVT